MFTQLLSYHGSIQHLFCSLSYEAVQPFLDSLHEDCVSIRERDQIYGILQDDYLFVVGCLRRLGATRMRLCGAWVAPLVRGRGWGEACVRYRLEHIPPEIAVLDTFAFHPRLYTAFGFQAMRQYKIGTTYLRRRL